jgi:hypothetical protein
VFQPEPSIGLRYHQAETIKRAKEKAQNGRAKPDWGLIEFIANRTHEVHIVNYDHLSTFVGLVNDPPRLQTIQFSLSVNGGSPTTFKIGQ